MLSDLVVAYLFFGGAGAGACFVASLLSLRSPRGAVRNVEFAPYYGRFYVATYSCAAACLLVGAVCLSFDLGRFDALVVLLFSPRISYIAVGSFAVLACFALAVLSAHVANVARPFDRALSIIAKCDAALIAVEVACLVALTVSALHVDAANQTQAMLLASAENLVLGDFAPAFWLGLIAVGLVAPLLFDILWAKSGHSPRFALAACACVLVGSIVLRACLVGAGAHPEISTL